MAYILIAFNQQEIERRDLTGPLVVGRAPDCHVPVRDILLSRRHIRLEPAGGGWIVRELGSKNGSMVNDGPLTDMAMLRDGDIVRLGRVQITYRLGRLANAGLRPTRTAPQRPADPMDALSGTISGFQMLEPGEGECHEDMPLPQPEPKRPAAFERDDVYSLLTTIASSSWDSIYAQAQQPLRPRRKEDRGDGSAPRMRPRSPIDLSLQVCAATDCRTVRPTPHRTWRYIALTRSRRLMRKVNLPNDRIRRRLPVAVIACWIAIYGLLAMKGSGGQAALLPRSASAKATTFISFDDSVQSISRLDVAVTRIPDSPAKYSISSPDAETTRAVLTVTLPVLAGAF